MRGMVSGDKRQVGYCPAVPGEESQARSWLSESDPADGVCAKGAGSGQTSRGDFLGLSAAFLGSQLPAAISPEAPPTGLKPSLPQVIPPFGALGAWPRPQLQLISKRAGRTSWLFSQVFELLIWNKQSRRGHLLPPVAQQLPSGPLQSPNHQWLCAWLRLVHP